MEYPTTPHLRFFLVKKSHEQTLEILDPGPIKSESELQELSEIAGKKFDYALYWKRYKEQIARFKEARESKHQIMQVEKAAFDGTKVGEKEMIECIESLDGFVRWIIPENELTQ